MSTTAGVAMQLASTHNDGGESQHRGIVITPSGVDGSAGRKCGRIIQMPIGKVVAPDRAQTSADESLFRTSRARVNTRGARKAELERMSDAELAEVERALGIPEPPIPAAGGADMLSAWSPGSMDLSGSALRDVRLLSSADRDDQARSHGETADLIGQLEGYGMVEPATERIGRKERIDLIQQLETYDMVGVEWSCEDPSTNETPCPTGCFATPCGNREEIVRLRATHKRHRPLAVTSVAQVFGGMFKGGARVEATITKGEFQHLAYKTWLEIELPAVEGLVEEPIAPSRPSGNIYDLIDYISIQIDGQEIDQHTGEWMRMYDELNVRNEHRTMLYHLTHWDEEPGFAYGEPRPAPVAFVRVPLNFWFCRASGNAIPILALKDDAVKVYIAFTDKVDEIPGIKARLWVDYVTVDDAEKRRILAGPADYVIEQVQTTERSKVSTRAHQTKKMKLDFNHPVKELLWVVRDQSGAARGRRQEGQAHARRPRGRAGARRGILLGRPVKHEPHVLRRHLPGRRRPGGGPVRRRPVPLPDPHDVDDRQRVRPPRPTADDFPGGQDDRPRPGAPPDEGGIGPAASCGSGTPPTPAPRWTPWPGRRMTVVVGAPRKTYARTLGGVGRPSPSEATASPPPSRRRSSAAAALSPSSTSAPPRRTRRRRSRWRSSWRRCSRWRPS